MEDFDQFFADKMKQAGSPDLSEKDWQQLSVRLDKFDRNRYRVLPLWWLGALTGLLLLSNLGWWYAWQQNHQKTLFLQSTWQDIQKNTVVTRDTVVNAVTVYQYDTIYKTTIIHQVEKETSNTFSQNNPPGQKTQNQYIVTENTTTESDLPIKNTTTALVVENTSQLTDTESSRSKVVHTWQQTAALQPLPRPELPLSISRQPPHLLPLNDLEITPQIVKKAPVKNMLKHTRLGVSTGTIQAVAKSIATSDGIIAGFSAEVPLSDHWGIVASADYGLVNMKGYVYDKSLGLPQITSPGSEYDFKYFETHEDRKTVVNLGLGARYWMTPLRPFSPYIGAGYVAQWHPAYELEMEYVNRNTGSEKSEEVEVDGSGPLSTLQMDLGFRYRITPHIHMHAGGFYQIKLKPEQQGIPYFRGLKAAFFYEL